MFVLRAIGLSALHCFTPLMLICLASCGTIAPESPIPTVQERTATNIFVLSSPNFKEGATIPIEQSCDGQDLSPELRWENPPQAKSFVLIVTDPDAPGGTFTHWTLYDIPGTQRELAKGLTQTSAPGKSGRNDFPNTGYGGPCPPRGAPAHHYIFTLSALDVETLNLAAGTARPAIEAAMQGHVIAQATLTGLYQRK